jgi:2-iminobutanoate/2-iminopropanoate deaminase
MSDPTVSKPHYIKLPGVAASLPFSNGVLIGNTCYLSGHLGLDPKTGMAPEEVEREIELLFEGLETTLRAANMELRDMVYVQIFCPDLALYDRFNKLYAPYFGNDLPARAFIGSGPLLRNARFEIQGIAVKT